MKLSYSLLCIIVLVSCIHARKFQDHCRSELDNGLRILKTYGNEIIEKERIRMKEKYEITRARIREIAAANPPLELDATTTEPCPSPNSTMFTTSTAVPTTKTTTTQASTTQSQTGATDQGTSAIPQDSSTASPNSPSSAPGTSASPQGTTDSSTVSVAPATANPSTATEEEVFHVRPLYAKVHHDDIVATHFHTVHKYLTAPEDVCEGPSITDLNSITEHQLYGYFSTLATSQPGPFCAFCHAVMTEVHDKLLRNSALLMTEEERLFRDALFSHIPSPMAICSMLAPGCYENYDDKAFNFTNSLECAKCSGCMTVTNLLQHRVLLQPTVMKSFLDFLKSSLFHNICAELCPDLSANKFTLFPNGFTYSGCVNWFAHQFEGFIRFVTVVTRPERFCSLELGWCELNETPNILHCLRELCEEYLGDTPQTTWVCSQIPDSPQEANAFLNIRNKRNYQDSKKISASMISRTEFQHVEL